MNEYKFSRLNYRTALLVLAYIKQIFFLILLNLFKEVKFKIKLKWQSRNVRASFFFCFPQHNLLSHEQMLPVFAKCKFFENRSNIHTRNFPVLVPRDVNINSGHVDDRSSTFPSPFFEGWGNSDPYLTISSLAPFFLKLVLVKTILETHMWLCSLLLHSTASDAG